MPEAQRARTLGALLQVARRRLREVDIHGGDLDARLLVEHATATSRSQVLIEPNQPIADAAWDMTLAMIERRASGEPTHRIIGEREFHGLRFKLNADTLEPRPDTETLVEAALPLVRALANRHGRCNVLDLGTGTGAIAISILAGEPRAHAVATDISQDALAAALINADLNDVASRLATLQSDWFAAVDGRYHLIVSNPPYIASSDIPLLAREVREHDPLRALDGGEDGLEPYRVIAQASRDHLIQDGMILVEMGKGQGGDVRAIFAEAGYRFVEAVKDLGGIERVLIFAV